MISVYSDYVQAQSNQTENCVFDSKSSGIKLKPRSGLQTFWPLNFQNIQTWVKMLIWKTWNVGKLEVMFDSTSEGWHAFFPVVNINSSTHGMTQSPQDQYFNEVRLFFGWETYKQSQKCYKKNYCEWKVIYLNQSPTRVLELTYVLVDVRPFRCSFKQEPRWLLNAKTSSLRIFLQRAIPGSPFSWTKVAE